MRQVQYERRDPEGTFQLLIPFNLLPPRIDCYPHQLCIWFVHPCKNKSRRLKMRVRTLLLFLILVLAVLIIAGSCATRKKAISIENASEIRSGIWINEAYQEPLVIQYPDGRYEMYYDLQQERLSVSGVSEIYESWWDSEGVLWYRAHYHDSAGWEGYVLGKISNSDNTLEGISTTNNLMIEEWKIGKVGYNYAIWYRQE